MGFRLDSIKENKKSQEINKMSIKWTKGTRLSKLIKLAQGLNKLGLPDNQIKDMLDHVNQLKCVPLLDNQEIDQIVNLVKKASK